MGGAEALTLGKDVEDRLIASGGYSIELDPTFDNDEE
jgi:hypothetical protein